MTRPAARHSALATAAVALGLVVSGGSGQRGTSAAQNAAPVITAAQAATGQGAYQALCAGCHMADLGGRGEASPLAGANFMSAWRARSTRELYDYIRTSMPPGGATLGADEYLSITAFILRSNGAAPGATALAPTTDVPIGSIATGSAPTASAQTAAPAAGGAAAGPRALCGR
jgi:alcohol dehydrogenase (cytochrome c)